MDIASILETLMMVLFGLSWPVNIHKAWTARTAKGTSVVFLFIIEVGYFVGIISKFVLIALAEDPWYITVPWYVITIYVINTIMVGIGIGIYFRNKKLDQEN